MFAKTTTCIFSETLSELFIDDKHGIYVFPCHLDCRTTVHNRLPSSTYNDALNEDLCPPQQHLKRRHVAGVEQEVSCGNGTESLARAYDIGETRS